MYEIWFNNVMFPVAPEKIQTEINGNNKTINLINEAEVNQIKGMKLTNFSFELMIPWVEYPFSVYWDSFQGQDYYLSIIKELKTSKKPFKLKIIRKDYMDNPTWDTSMNVTLESYKLDEEAENGLDVVIPVELKQYVKYGTKKVKVKGKKFRTSNVDTNKKKIVKSYTTKKGDTLRLVGKKVYGVNTLNNAEAIYKKNKSKVNNALSGKFNGKSTKRIYTSPLPAGIKLAIPGYYTNLVGDMVIAKG